MHHMAGSHIRVFFIRAEEIQLNTCTRNTWLGETQTALINLSQAPQLNSLQILVMRAMTCCGLQHH